MTSDTHSCFFSAYYKTNNKQLPTVEEIENVWNFEPGDTYREELLLWWVTEVLVAAIGPDYWSNEDKKYNLLVDKKLIPETKKTGTRIPIVGEAFARLQFKNYRNKWQNTFDFKAEHGSRAPLPLKKSDELFDKFKAVYSDNTVGQVKGAGWSPAAFSQFNSYIRDIKETRDKDKQAGWAMHRLALVLTKTKYGITTMTATPKKRKRKRPITPCTGTPIPSREDIIIVEE